MRLALAHAGNPAALRFQAGTAILTRNFFAVSQLVWRNFFKLVNPGRGTITVRSGLFRSVKYGRHNIFHSSKKGPPHYMAWPFDDRRATAAFPS